MENASNENETPAEKQPGRAPSYIMNPVWRLSPMDKANSNLYDSFELQAVTKQLNRAIHGSSDHLSRYSYYLKSSPFYRKQLNRIRRKNGNTPKRISCSQLERPAKDTKGFVVRLWRKVKRGFVRSKKEDSDFCG